MPGAGQLDRRITFERGTSTSNSLNEQVVTWGPVSGLGASGTVWAKRTDVSDGEKNAGGQVGSFLQSRFVIRASIAARTLKPTDRINYVGIWSITGIKETTEGRNAFLEVTAVRDAD